MSRPTLEVADIVRATGNSFWQQQQSHLSGPLHPSRGHLQPSARGF